MESTITTGQTLQTIPQIQQHNYSPQSTDEQVNIYNWVENGEGHLLIKARAGSGKTTTLVEICRLLPPNESATFLAFNRHIKEELSDRLPKSVFCYTAHGLGYNAIMRKYKDCEINHFKADAVIQKLSHKWDMTGIDNVEQYYTNMKKMINLVRLSLTLDKKYVPDLCEKYQVKFDKQDIDRLFSVLEIMLNDKKTIDYTDMVYLPVVDKKIWMFPQDWILVDEAQDLSKAQHELIKKAIKRDKTGKILGRMIFVGDDMQAIYGFTGSDAYSFMNLAKIPNMTVLPLTMTFRCAKNIVLEANKLVPDIRPTDYAPDGIVRIGHVLHEVEAGDFVLSRKTLPLVKLFFELLIEGRKSYIKGSDIGESLIDFTEGKNTLSQLDASLTNRLEVYRTNLRRHGILDFDADSGYVALKDKVGILKFMISMNKNSDPTKAVEDIKSRIRHIFKGKDGEAVPLEGVILSTVHKAKGLEANRVFIIMPKDMPLRTALPWQYQQELNLKYIAITRAKRELVYDLEWKLDDGTFDGFRD
jgi:DNA helicase II / ATP-dependent DNA helicase PcrA